MPQGKLHKTLKLAHHQHTAKRLPHHHTSYRGLWVVLALMALFIVMVEHVAADSYQVRATVPSAVLDQPAVITSHSTGAIVSVAQLTVSGRCQVTINETIVTLERDTTLMGSAACRDDGTFSIDLTLQPGDNNLLPKVRTGGGALGPDGQYVDIVYQLPIPPTQGSGGSTPSQPLPIPGQAVSTGGTSLLSLISSNEVLMYGSNGQTRLHLVIGGGTAPYTVNVDWGDGTVDQGIAVRVPGSVEVRHDYEVPDIYTVKVVSTDAKGQESVYQVVAVKAGPLATSSITPTAPSIGTLSALASPASKLVWGSYGTVTVGVVAIWTVSHAAVFAHAPAFLRPLLIKRRW